MKIVLLVCLLHYLFPNGRSKEAFCFPKGPYQPSDQLKLKFYGYFKQATMGPCSQPRPGFWDVKGRAKWQAWEDCAPLSKEDAMRAYIEEIKKVPMIVQCPLFDY